MKPMQLCTGFIFHTVPAFITATVEGSPKIVSEYDQEIPKSQTADKPMAPRSTANKNSGVFFCFCCFLSPQHILQRVFKCLFQIKIFQGVHFSGRRGPSAYSYGNYITYDFPGVRRPCPPPLWIRPWTKQN